MDNSVSGRFYHLVEENVDGGTFIDILEGIAKKTLVEREKDIGAEANEPVIVRLESWEENGEFVFGEFIRKQISNKPPEANKDGLAPLELSDNSGLGHSNAFRLHRPTSTICLQGNPYGVSMRRIENYIFAFAPRSKFVTQRTPTEDAIERFRTGDARSIEIQIGSPLSLPEIEGEDGGADKTVVDASRMLAEAFQGLTVTIEVSMGRKLGELPQGPIEQLITRMLPWKSAGTADIRKLRSKSKNPNGEGPAEIINFLEEFLVEATKISLSDTDPVYNYEVRRDQLSNWHNKHLDYLTRLYDT